jgi:energy-coupling factor transporter ATP-binding protein EcfA2
MKMLRDIIHFEGTKIYDVILHTYKRMVKIFTSTCNKISSWNYEAIDSVEPEAIERGQYFIKHIMKDYEEIANSGGMKVLRDIIRFEGTKVYDVILRTITEEYWQKVIEATENNRVCAVGSPGIGKSSTTCILIRLLLQKKKTVVYHLRDPQKEGLVYIFSPSTVDSTINMDVLDENNFKRKHYNTPSTYYVVDPGKTKVTCDLGDTFKGKVIIVASPDSRHWGESEFFKHRDDIGGIFLVYPVWSLDELLLARQHINSNISNEDIEQRYGNVGGIPRHIFATETEYEKVLNGQKNAINELRSEQLQKMSSGDMDSVRTLSEHQPRSILMVYGDSGPSFQDFTVEIASRHVFDLLSEKHKIFLWKFMISQGVEWGGIGWKTFEAYCQNLLKGQPTKYKDYKLFDGKDWVDGSNDLQFGGCTAVIGTRKSIIAEAKLREKIVYYSLDPGNKLIDFVYRDGSVIHAFQVTLAQSHSCNAQHIIECASEAGGSKHFMLHYLVYDTKYSGFKFKENPMNDLPENEKWTINIVRMKGPSEDQEGIIS